MDTVGQAGYFLAVPLLYFVINLLFTIKYLIMKHLFKKTRLLTSGLLVVICLTAFIGTATAGLDHYEIYIGKKLIFKRALNQPLSLEHLPISEANSNEQLIIYYYQCNAPDKMASSRVITLQDAQGNKIKEWKFADAKGSNTGMAISIKELLQLQKTGKSSFALFYSAEGKPQREKLVSVASISKTVGFLEVKKTSNHQAKIAMLLIYMKRYMIYSI